VLNAANSFYLKNSNHPEKSGVYQVLVDAMNAAMPPEVDAETEIEEKLPNPSADFNEGFYEPSRFTNFRVIMNP